MTGSDGGGMRGSLTWFVRTQKAFWRQAVPHAPGVVHTFNSQLLSFPLKVPLGPHNRRMVGPLHTAVDYFVGWMVGDSLDGALTRAGFVSTDAARLAGFALQLLRRLHKALQPQYPFGTPSNADLLARLLLLVARMDAAFRTGFPYYVPRVKGLDRLDPLRSPLPSIHETLRGGIPDALARECLALVREAALVLPGAKRAVYNPTFGSYGLVNGADGDLFSDGTLYDLKCVTAGFRLEDLWQLLGYCALNRLNQARFEIDRIGLINPRRGFVWSEDVDAVCAAAGAGSLARLAEELRSALTSPRVAPR